MRLLWLLPNCWVTGNHPSKIGDKLNLSLLTQIKIYILMNHSCYILGEERHKD